MGLRKIAFQVPNLVRDTIHFLHAVPTFAPRTAGAAMAWSGNLVISLRSCP